jgi:hypothetical protein
MPHHEAPQARLRRYVEVPRTGDYRRDLFPYRAAQVLGLCHSSR